MFQVVAKRPDWVALMLYLFRAVARTFSAFWPLSPRVYPLASAPCKPPMFAFVDIPCVLTKASGDNHSLQASRFAGLPVTVFSCSAKLDNCVRLSLDSFDNKISESIVWQCRQIPALVMFGI